MRFGSISPHLGIAGLLAACSSDSVSPPENIPPTAAFGVACTGLTCSLTDASTDIDGSVGAYAWDFGDGLASALQSPEHAFPYPGGQFTVTLTVTDDDGATGTAARQVTVQPDNAGPLAAFDVACTLLTCTFTDRSADPDAEGAIVSWAWDFGDGQVSVQQNPIHTYASRGGRFSVTLSVTDDLGAQATAGRGVTVVGAEWPDLSGTYERETTHSTPGRHSRIVLRDDFTFELFDSTGAGTTTYPGQWIPQAGWLGAEILEAGTVIALEFEAFAQSASCGAAYGVFQMEGHLGISYCRPAIEAGLEEGLYSRLPGTGTTLPPPAAGQIAFVRGGRVFRVNSDGSGLVQLTDGPDDWGPAWSPDGSRIAFSSRNGSGWDIHVADADGANDRLVLMGDGYAAEPAWSPDGQWIAFACVAPGGGQASLCKVEVDGDPADPVLVAPWLHGWIESPSWSPDGTRIAFLSDWAMFDIMLDIWVIAPDGSQHHSLVSHTAEEPNPWAFHQPAWSPDGQRITYVTCPWAWYPCTSGVVGVMNADGTGKTPLVAAGSQAWPTWSPDGQVIAFTSAGGVLEWISADGNQRGRMVDNARSPAWRP